MPDGPSPDAAAAAGAAHGQLATTLSGGGVSLSGHKIVEQGARALLLLLPGLFRVDVRPLEDGLQVIPRVLCDVPLGWEIDPAAMTDYGRTAEETSLPALVAFRMALWTEPQPLAGRVFVTYTRAGEHAPSHFAAHAVIQQVSANR
jgi:hypothetical protein